MLQEMSCRTRLAHTTPPRPTTRSVGDCLNSSDRASLTVVQRTRRTLGHSPDSFSTRAFSEPSHNAIHPRRSSDASPQYRCSPQLWASRNSGTRSVKQTLPGERGELVSYRWFQQTPRSPPLRLQRHEYLQLNRSFSSSIRTDKILKLRNSSRKSKPWGTMPFSSPWTL